MFYFLFDINIRIIALGTLYCEHLSRFESFLTVVYNCRQQTVGSVLAALPPLPVLCNQSPTFYCRILQQSRQSFHRHKGVLL